MKIVNYEDSIPSESDEEEEANFSCVSSDFRPSEAGGNATKDQCLEGSVSEPSSSSSGLKRRFMDMGFAENMVPDDDYSLNVHSPHVPQSPEGEDDMLDDENDTENDALDNDLVDDVEILSEIDKKRLQLLEMDFPIDEINLALERCVTVFFGASDAALLGRTSERQHVPIPEYKENLREIVSHIKKSSPSVLVVLITPPPIDEVWRIVYASENAAELPERTNEVTGLYADKCVELATEMGIPYVNLWSKMQMTEGWQMLLSDGLHFTPEGNTIVYEEVIRMLFAGGLCAPEMPNDFPRHSEVDPKNPEKTFS